MEDVRVDVDLRIVPATIGGGRSRSPFKRTREGEGSDGAEACGAPKKRERPGPASSKERRPSYVSAKSATATTTTSETGVRTGAGGRDAEPNDPDASPRKPTAPRASSRGRPPESGKYIGVGKLREEKQKKRQEERYRELTRQRLREEAIEREERSKLGLSPAWPPLPKRGGSTTDVSVAHVDEDTSDDEEARKRSPKEALKRLNQQIEVIKKVAKCSSNLKGTFIKGLKDATALIQEEARALRAATSTEETRRLERENKKLRREMGELTREVAEIKKCVRTKGALPGETPPPPQERGKEEGEVAAFAANPPTGGGSIEDVITRVINTMTLIIDGKMAALKDRFFLRERPMRPPLEADKKREAASKKLALRAAPKEVLTGATRGAAAKRPAASAAAATGQSVGEEKKRGLSKTKAVQAATKKPGPLHPDLCHSHRRTWGKAGWK